MESRRLASVGSLGYSPRGREVKRRGNEPGRPKNTRFAFDVTKMRGRCQENLAGGRVWRKYLHANEQHSRGTEHRGHSHLGFPTDIPL